jgi:hypothetical protein
MTRHGIRLMVWFAALTILLGGAFVASGQNMREGLSDYAADGAGGTTTITEAQVLKRWERSQINPKLRLPNPSVPPDASLQRIIANHKNRFGPAHGNCETRIYTTINNQGPGPLQGPLTFITAQWTLPSGKFNFGQVLVIGHYYKDGELRWTSVVCGGGDNPGQVEAWLKAMCRPGAEEQDEAAKPERPTLTVTGTETRDGRLYVTGTITSKTPIRSTLMMRTEGGAVHAGTVRAERQELHR